MLNLIWNCEKCSREAETTSVAIAETTHFECKECGHVMKSWFSYLSCDICGAKSERSPISNALAAYNTWYGFSCSSKYHNETNWTSGYQIREGEVHFESEKCFDRWLDENRHLIIAGAKKSYPASTQKPFI